MQMNGIGFMKGAYSNTSKGLGFQEGAAVECVAPASVTEDMVVSWLVKGRGYRVVGDVVELAEIALEVPSAFLEEIQP